MIINNVEFAFDANKLSDLDRYENALNVLKVDLEKGDAQIKEQMLLATGTRTHLNAFKTFFEDVAGVDVLGDTEDTGLCMACLEDFNLQIAEQKKMSRTLYFAKKKGGRK